MSANAESILDFISRELPNKAKQHEQRAKDLAVHRIGEVQDVPRFTQEIWQGLAMHPLVRSVLESLRTTRSTPSAAATAKFAPEPPHVNCEHSRDIQYCSRDILFELSCAFELVCRITLCVHGNCRIMSSRFCPLAARI